jgi:putative membrane protein
MNRFMTTVTAAALLAAAPAFAQATRAAKGASPAGRAGGAGDPAFVKEAAMGGMAEVELGKLAAEKASNADVKKFGQRMVDDHSKANDELKMIAGAKNVTLPSALDAKHKATVDRLSKLSGDAFDRAYMRDMVADHVQDVAAFKRESQAGKDADVKAFASKTLPTLEDHLKMARMTDQQVVSSSSGKGNTASSRTSTKGTSSRGKTTPKS